MQYSGPHRTALRATTEPSVEQLGPRPLRAGAVQWPPPYRTAAHKGGEANCSTVGSAAWIRAVQWPPAYRIAAHGSGNPTVEQLGWPPGVRTNSTVAPSVPAKTVLRGSLWFGNSCPDGESEWGYPDGLNIGSLNAVND